MSGSKHDVQHPSRAAMKMALAGIFLFAAALPSARAFAAPSTSQTHGVFSRHNMAFGIGLSPSSSGSLLAHGALGMLRGGSDDSDSLSDSKLRSSPADVIEEAATTAAAAVAATAEVSGSKSAAAQPTSVVANGKATSSVGQSTIIAEDSEFIKPLLDTRSYRAITLPNGLTCLLVSDPLTDVEAGSVHINSGHFQDPEHRPGLAHFHEHMLFLGTEKYPDENDFETFLGRNGGSSNAFTDMEDTNY